MDWLYYLLLALVMVAGLALNLMSLPGLWLMLLGVLIYAWVTGWVYVGWVGLLVLLILVIAAEVAEAMLGSAAAKKAGGGTRAAVGAMVGGFLGALFLTFGLLVIGTVIGACLGSFAGALIGEMSIRRNPAHLARVGWAAARGRLWAVAVKLGFGILILLTGLILAIPL
jgi:uncharacterized protein YqgC (DUF456 family)